jgi:hypothetical protein
MSAIITDQIRILNAKNFVSSLISNENSYYSFMALPNATDYNSDWEQSPPAPIDNFNQENDCWDTLISLKKISNDDVRQVVRKNTWQSGITYDMYRHDISRNNLSKPSNSTNLYSSNYYIINSDYRVYICLQNGTDPDNIEGRPSLDEPTFTDLEPKEAGDSGDGYIWKYLYTIKPSDIIKFDSINFIPVPKNWESNSLTASVKNNSLTSGQLKIIVIKNRGTLLANSGTYTDVPIKGDGIGATATIVVNTELKVDSITVSNGGSGYTYGTVDFKSANIQTNGGIDPAFVVIIPPNGGHGYDIYRELGAYNVLVYSRVENDLQNPDFIIGNQIARVGIVQNPEVYDSGSDSILQLDKASGVYALKLIGISNVTDYKNITYESDSLISQTISVGNTAIGRVVSYDNNTGVLKYWQDRTMSGFNYDGSQNDTPTYGFNSNKFTAFPSTGGNLQITGGKLNGVSVNLAIDDLFGTQQNPGITTTLNNNTTYYLGQSFVNGVSNPEVKKYSGNIIYIDNRPSITRSPNQKEDIKVILQF